MNDQVQTPTGGQTKMTKKIAKQKMKTIKMKTTMIKSTTRATTGMGGI